jgi:rhamnosyltransferase
MEGKRLAAVTVTYHADAVRLARQFAYLPRDALLVVVDNASLENEVASLRQLVQDRPGTVLMCNRENVGLAAAVNQGVAEALRLDAAIDFLLLMDQDSIPREGAVSELVDGFLRMEAAGVRLGGVGPRLMDETTNLQHGFHTLRGWFLHRIFPAADAREPVECLGINGSGTLTRAKVFQSVGGLEEDFFIDQIDTEWSFRMRAAGFRLFGLPQAVFDHNMGVRGVAYWFFGWRVWPHRSAQRHYYVFRNARRLFARPYAPLVWKFWNVVKLLLTFIVHGIFDADRKAQMRNMVRGLRDGRRM